MFKNPLTCADGYKQGHVAQYPPGTEYVYANLTPRSARLKNIPDEIWEDRVTFFGLQFFIKDYLVDCWAKEFFLRPKDVVLRKFKRRMDRYLGKDAVSTEHVAKLHDLGYLPISIRALPEGVQVPIRVPLLTIINTHPDFAWLTNFLETALSAYLWKATTAATVARHYRLLAKRFAEMTCDNNEHLDYCMHDFSARGDSGLEDATVVGMAHLTSFCGTDSIMAIDGCESFYNADCEQEVLAGSVPASEHSCSCLSIFEIEEQFRTNGEWNGIKLEDV